MRSNAPLPYALLVLEAAREFQVLPEVIENRMTARWWKLWLVYREEMNRARSR